MSLSEAQIQEFKDIYQKRFGRALDDKQARLLAKKLYNLILLFSTNEN